MNDSLNTDYQNFEYPEQFARFYDLIYHQMRDSVDAEYFTGECTAASGKVLEIGVGTGRMFTNSLEKGADIYGIDISESMLDILYRKLPRDQHFRVSMQNIIDFSFDFKFDLIVAPFRVFMHLIDKQDQLRALNNVYGHLKKNGRFIFDVFVPNLNQLITGLKDVTDFEGEYEEGKKVKRMVSTTPDLINQIINIKFLIEWEEKDGLKHMVWKFPMRYYFRFELEHLAERSKFEDYYIMGDYRGNKLSEESKEFIVVCRKKK